MKLLGVYILKGTMTGRYYVGSTSDFNQRFKDHNAGKVISTRRGRPWKLECFIPQTTILDTRRTERRLKKYKSKDIIQKVIGSGVLPWEYKRSD